MSIWFAIKTYGYEGDAVFGPFSKRRVATDFIEKGKENGGCVPWWSNDWYIAEIDVSDKWQDRNHITHHSGKPYRPAYCETMREERHRQWAKEHPDEAKYWEEMAKGAAAFFREEPIDKPKEIINNLKFGQRYDVKIRKEK